MKNERLYINIQGNIVERFRIMRYLLHLTAAKNLKSILKHGLKAVRTSSNCDPMAGIFMVSAEDLKYWNNVVLDTGFTLRKGILDCLIQQASKNTNEIVALRIPLKKLKAPIKIRDQAIVLEDRIATKNLVTNEERIQLRKLFSDKSRCTWEETKLCSSKIDEHCANGVSFSKAKSLQEKKRAIEYIYPDDIPPEAIEYIGKADVRKTTKEVFEELFAGQPERHSLLTWG